MIGASAVEHADQPADVLDAWTDIISFLLADNGIQVRKRHVVKHKQKSN
jgi:hypothetical protein